MRRFLAYIAVASLAWFAASPASAQSAKDRVNYAEITVKGGFGEEITAHGLEKALDLCRKRKVTYVIFKLESPGGYLYEANAILDLLNEYDEYFEYITIIEKGGAFSAATVFVVTADILLIRPGGAFGAATAYSTDSSTGSTEVDAKLNSGWASQLASAAEAKGRPGLPFRAMAEMEVEVFGNEETGEFSSKSGGDDWVELDGDSTILTLRAVQAEAYGLGQVFEGRARDIAEILEIDPKNWKTRGPAMSQAFIRAGKKRIKLEKDWERTLADFARSYDLIPVTIGSNLGKQTALRYINESLAALTNMADLNRDAQDTGALHLQIPDNMGHDAYVNIDAMRQRVLNMRFNQ